ncbi:MAG: winged helix-turn-helix transcriptional regulator [Bacteroidales bacterium]|nr:winged helix-turn-helix transcriptional regulator [Bacteroidales bacterium]
MGITKTDLFSAEQNEMARILKAMGHPARVAILEYLDSVNACICGDIVSELPLAQPTISQHLRELKNAGLIKGNVEGNTICYCIDETAIGKIREYFAHFKVCDKQGEINWCNVKVK